MMTKIKSVKISRDELFEQYRSYNYKEFWKFFGKIIIVDQPRMRQITSKWTSQKMREFKRLYHSKLKEAGYLELVKVMEDFDND